MTHDCEWTNDCQGKKDYDGQFVSVSTRYWPPGGGFWAVHTAPGQPVIIDKNPAPHALPSAHSAVYVGDSVWREKKFEAATPEEVFLAVESWVDDRFREVCSLLGISPEVAS